MAKMGMMGMIGSLNYIADREFYMSCFKPEESLEVYKNDKFDKNLVVDYMNWGAGWGR